MKEILNMNHDERRGRDSTGCNPIPRFAQDTLSKSKEAFLIAYGRTPGTEDEIIEGALLWLKGTGTLD